MPVQEQVYYMLHAEFAKANLAAPLYATGLPLTLPFFGTFMAPVFSTCLLQCSLKIESHARYPDQRGGCRLRMRLPSTHVLYIHVWKQV